MAELSELLWDVGAGCGSIALPWMRTRVQGDRDAIALHPTRY
ncbi:hypothetical protein [Microcoleus sp. CAWBG58]|nr:hypothetical protein [Microcoleus sp. CAWBG58]